MNLIAFSEQLGSRTIEGYKAFLFATHYARNNAVAVRKAVYRHLLEQAQLHCFN
jgi:hypothetical protein